MRKRVLDRSIDLRHAAHRIRVLHALTVLVAAADLAVREQQAQATSRFDLTRQSARSVNAGIERA